MRAKQAPVAPLLVVYAGEEPPFEDRAVAFQRGERGRYRVRLKPERRGKHRWRDRPETLEPAAQDLDQRVFARPGRFSLVSGRRDLRLKSRIRPNRLKLSEPLGRNP